MRVIRYKNALGADNLYGLVLIVLSQIDKYYFSNNISKFE